MMTTIDKADWDLLETLHESRMAKRPRALSLTERERLRRLLEDVLTDPMMLFRYTRGLTELTQRDFEYGPLSYERSEKLVHQGVTILTDDELTRLLFSPSTLHALAEELDEVLPEAFQPAMERWIARHSIPRQATQALPIEGPGGAARGETEAEARWPMGGSSTSVQKEGEVPCQLELQAFELQNSEAPYDVYTARWLWATAPSGRRGWVLGADGVLPGVYRVRYRVRGQAHSIKEVRDVRLVVPPSRSATPLRIRAATEAERESDVARGFFEDLETCKDEDRISGLVGFVSPSSHDLVRVRAWLPEETIS